MSAPVELLPIPLLEWFRDNARTLPWRSDPTPYHVWLSEIMLQQTRVAAVLGYYERFLRAAPTVQDLAALTPDELMKLWQGLGYYNRARSLHKTAKLITEAYGGRFPDTVEGLLALPGVGEYTAGAVASIAFGRTVPAVDGNVLRVVSRVNGDPSDVDRPATRTGIRDQLAAILPVGEAGRFNQAMMDLGATVCLPGGAPLCMRCPARDFCRARREGRQTELPVRGAKKARRLEELDVYLIFSGRRAALRRRPDRGLLAGLWEYPNAPAGAEPGFAAGLIPTGEREAGRHIFTHVEWRMTARCYTAPADWALPDGWVWAGREELARLYAVPGAFRPFEAAVERHLGGGGL